MRSACDLHIVMNLVGKTLERMCQQKERKQNSFSVRGFNTSPDSVFKSTWFPYKLKIFFYVLRWKILKSFYYLQRNSVVKEKNIWIWIKTGFPKKIIVFVFIALTSPFIMALHLCSSWVAFLSGRCSFLCHLTKARFTVQLITLFAEKMTF